MPQCCVCLSRRSWQVTDSRDACTPRAIWKLNWFLRDFGYDTELLSRGEINDSALIGLVGVVKVKYTTIKGLFYLSFEAFAPAEKWKQLSDVSSNEQPGSEVA